LNQNARGDVVAKPAFRNVYNPCFRTIDSFIEALDGLDATAFRDIVWTKPLVGNCSELAKAVWHHQVPALNHFYYDTQHISNILHTAADDTAILLVRQEALWQEKKAW
jgi:hypothetical protein